MDERFYISTTNIPPFSPVDTIDFDLTISATEGVDVKEEIKKFYLVIEAGVGHLDWVKISAEGLAASGIAVEVSKLDPMDVPIKWQSSITFEDVDATSSPAVFPFAIKFSALNNIYVLRDRKGGCLIQIYTPE